MLAALLGEQLPSIGQCNSSPGLEKKKKMCGSFRYAPTDHFTSVDVPLNTTVPSLWQAASLITPPVGQMFLTTNVWSFILCGLVEKLFKLGNQPVNLLPLML